MSVQCQGCGSFVTKSGFKVHLQTDKCRKVREMDEKYQHKCRKCGLFLEKLWHAELHACDGVKIYDPEMEELRMKCKFYTNFISAMGLHLDIDWEKVKNGTHVGNVPPKIVLQETYSKNLCPKSTSVEVSDVEVSDVEVSDVAPLSEELKVSEPSKHVFREYIQELSLTFSDSVSNFQVISNLILNNQRESEDGEDIYYMLGNKLGEFVAREYPRNPDSKIINVFSDLHKVVDKIRNTIDEREHFINGVNDSFCGDNISGYIMLNLNLFDQTLRFDPKSLLSSKSFIGNMNPMSIEEIVRTYSCVYAMVPITDFIDVMLMDTKMRRYVYAYEQFYRRELSGFTIDPWMLDLTYALSNTVLEVCSELFMKAYKTVYSDNIYREGWGAHPFLKQFQQVYKNIEIASTVFDLNHILRKKIMSGPSGNTYQIEQMNTNHARNTEWALMSTRINAGIPGFELVNFFDTLFEPSTVTDVSAKWMKKYLSGLKSFSGEYRSSPRFKSQVSEEAKQYM
jgi:hypothetical protein